jgi:mRNA-decapping enzyme subunit 2
MSIELRDGLANQNVDLVLEDLLVRFLVNCPDEDLSSIERVFFQVEEAQWFYTDFVRQLNPALPSMKMKSFAPRFLEKCPLIWKWGDANNAISRFGKYKSTIPVRGIACFNKDLSKLLLVKGTESNTWSFPRGKISKDESDIDCAIREGEEEIGYNVKDSINENDAIERTIRGKHYKIYMIKNVDENYNFQPKSRNEISQIKWHDIKSIQKKSRTNPNSFFIVNTVLKPMVKWINKNKGIPNEDELKYIAELKLKDLLGINKPQENVDAGRELLNILQNAVPKNTNGPLIQVPQNIQIPIQNLNMFPYQYGSGPHHDAPFFNPLLASPFGNLIPPPPPPPQQQPYPNSPSYDPTTNHPNPQSFQKPPQFRNDNSDKSKELLSILNTKSEKKEPSTRKKTTTSESNRSKAQDLLNLFKKHSDEESIKKPTPEINTNDQSSENPLRETPAESILNLLHKDKKNTTLTSEPSNELEGSYLQDEETHNYPKPDKKIKILQRSNKVESSNAASLLGLLKGPRAEAQEPAIQPLHRPAEVAHEPVPITSTTRLSNELLDILKNSRPSKATNTTSASNSNTKTSTNAPAATPTSQTLERKHSNALLDLLRPSQPLQVATNPTNEIMDLLKKPNQNAQQEPPVQETSIDNFEDFEDFEDFGGIESEFKQRFDNFDIASDEEDVDHILESMSSINRTKEPEPINLFQDHSLTDTKKKIRILKPGQDIKDILGVGESSEPFKAEQNIQGQNLTALLNNNESACQQTHHNVQRPDTLHSIYGTTDYQAPHVATPDVGSNNKSSAFFMDLLNKRN